MKNEIKIYNFDKSLTQEQNIKNFILAEIDLKRALMQMSKVKSIYGDEIEEQSNNLHITKGGEAMFVAEMKDSHLINTINLLLRTGKANFSSRGLKKYITEVKKRGLVSEIINTNVAEDRDEPFFEEDLEDMDWN